MFHGKLLRQTFQMKSMFQKNIKSNLIQLRKPHNKLTIIALFGINPNIPLSVVLKNNRKNPITLEKFYFNPKDIYSTFSVAHTAIITQILYLKKLQSQ